MKELIPVTVLTGFLGSGKTTALRHLGQLGKLEKTLVLVNEFGEMGLDHELLVPIDDDALVAVSSGCICCTIRADLVQTLSEAPWRYARAGSRWFDRVVIETTGIADPAPILQTILGDHRVTKQYELVSVLTTVDAVNGLRTLEQHAEAVKQVAVADRILLTKLDLVATNTAPLQKLLTQLAPGASIHSVLAGAANPDWFFCTGLYSPRGKSADVEAWLNSELNLSVEQNARYDTGHEHDLNRHGRIEAICLAFAQPVDPALFESCLHMLMEFRGADLLRVKGIVNVQGIDRPMVIHGVQHVFHPPEMLEQWPGDDRRTRLVIIARDLNRDEVRNAFSALGLEASER